MHILRPTLGCGSRRHGWFWYFRIVVTFDVPGTPSGWPKSKTSHNELDRARRGRSRLRPQLGQNGPELGRIQLGPGRIRPDQGRQPKLRNSCAPPAPQQHLDRRPTSAGDRAAPGRCPSGIRAAPFPFPFPSRHKAPSPTRHRAVLPLGLSSGVICAHRSVGIASHVCKRFGE